ncbi:MAG: hypothetical protein QGD88_11960 [Anaerolineae bacterium]|nr:hypothetical protein [Anaerolineae bacterium]MDK1082175.1 hypothetical protein [Anaerolineae bacterium]
MPVARDWGPFIRNRPYILLAVDTTPVKKQKNHWLIWPFWVLWKLISGIVQFSGRNIGIGIDDRGADYQRDRSLVGLGVCRRL